MDHGYDFNRIITILDRYDIADIVFRRWWPDYISGIQRFYSIRTGRMADRSLNQETKKIKGLP